MLDQSQDQVIAAWREMLTSLLDRYLSALGAGVGKDGTPATQAAVYEKIIQATKDKDTKNTSDKWLFDLLGATGLVRGIGMSGGPALAAGALGVSAVAAATNAVLESDVYKYEQTRTYDTLEKYAEAAGEAGVNLTSDQMKKMQQFYQQQSEAMSRNVELAKIEAGIAPDTYHMVASWASHTGLEWMRGGSDLIDRLFLENQKVQDREINRGK